MIFLKIQLYNLTVALIALLLLVILLIISVLIYGYRNYQLINNAQHWKKLIEDKVSYSILNGIEVISADEKFLSLLKKSNFKKIFISVLIESDQRFVGDAHKILRDIFYMFKLDDLAWTKLKSKNIYQNVRGIQVMTAMHHEEAIPMITAHLSHKNKYVYTEAQYSVVRFNGFAGLHFLDTLEKPLSQWQQMRLVQAIQTVSQSNFDAIAQWLSSTNLSVISFTLSLIRKFRLLTLHNQVATLLDHNSIEIRISAVKTLQSIESAETVIILINSYDNQDDLVKIEIIKYILQAKNKNHSEFLKKVFEQESNIYVQIATVNALSRLNEYDYIQEKYSDEDVSLELKQILENALSR